MAINPSKDNISKTPHKNDLKGQTNNALQKLFGVSNGEVAAEGLKLVPPNQIATSPQPRTIFPVGEMKELADSIAAMRSKRGGIEGTGVLQPLLVRPLQEGESSPTGARYRLIAGERRWRAATSLQLPLVPVIVLPQESISDPSTTLAAQIIENLQRRDLVPLEEARALRHFMDESKLSIREAANWLGKPKSYLSDRLALLKMGEDVLQLLSERSDTLVHARILDGVKDQALRTELIDLVRQGASLREIQSRVNPRVKKASPNTAGNEQNPTSNKESSENVEALSWEQLTEAANIVEKLIYQAQHGGLPQDQDERKKTKAAATRLNQEIRKLQTILGEARRR